jgi:hypothetical protein
MQGSTVKEYLCMCSNIYIDTCIHIYVGQRESKRDRYTRKSEGKQGERGDTRHLTIYFLFLFLVFILFGTTTTPQWARNSSFTKFLNHTQRPTTVDRTPLDE